MINDYGGITSKSYDLLSIKLALKKLKWSPNYTLESGIKETCEYYIKNLK